MRSTSQGACSIMSRMNFHQVTPAILSVVGAPSSVDTAETNRIVAQRTLVRVQVDARRHQVPRPGAELSR
jgi:hypothetical protein